MRVAAWFACLGVAAIAALGILTEPSSPGHASEPHLPADDVVGASTRDRSVAPRAGRPRRRAAPPAACEPPARSASANADTFRIVPDGAVGAPPPRRLTGRVVDVDGNPLGGVPVRLNSTWLSDLEALENFDIEIGQSCCPLGFTGAEAATTSAPDGTFSLRYTDGGARTLFVPGDRQTVRAIAHDPPGDAPARLVLDAPGREVAGCVTDASGRPVAGAEVYVLVTTLPVPDVRLRAFSFVCHCSTPHWGARATTDELGRWRLSGVPDADAGVHASAGDHGPSDPWVAAGLPASRRWSDVRLTAPDGDAAR